MCASLTGAARDTCIDKSSTGRNWALERGSSRMPHTSWGTLVIIYTLQTMVCSIIVFVKPGASNAVVMMELCVVTCAGKGKAKPRFIRTKWQAGKHSHRKWTNSLDRAPLYDTNAARYLLWNGSFGHNIYYLHSFRSCGSTPISNMGDIPILWKWQSEDYNSFLTSNLLWWSKFLLLLPRLCVVPALADMSLIWFLEKWKVDCEKRMEVLMPSFVFGVW